MSTDEKEICERGGEKGVFFPSMDWEYDLPKMPWQFLLYGIALGWFFMGVGIISNVFMNAIEAITARKVRIYDKVTGRHRTIKVWNETVANLTLMALGSSAPEILLNVVEVAKNKFFAGALGPGTIVGSAAFNLLVISAVCVMAIPDGEFRVINDVTVYAVTASFSLFAYLWLLVILMFLSKDVILFWEALVTLMLFPMLVMISFAADKGWITGVAAIANRRPVAAADMSKEELAQIAEDIKETFGDIDDVTLAVLVEKKTAATPSKSQLRAARWKIHNAGSMSRSSSNTNTKDMSNTMANLQSDAGYVSSKGSSRTSKDSGQGESSHSTKGNPLRQRSQAVPDGQSTVEFATSHYAVLESSKSVVAEVGRVFNTKNTVSVKYRTKEGTASAGKDYIAVEGTLVFQPGEKKKQIAVQVLDDDAWEQSEDFYIELFDLQTDKGTVVLGENHTATVTIIDDDDPGAIAFDKDYIVHESDQAGEVTIKVVRKHGSSGEISCIAKSEDDSAVSPLDYEELEGETLTFKEGEMSKDLNIIVSARGRYESKERFRVILENPVGCRFDTKADGNESQIYCTVELQASAQNKQMIDRLANVVVGNFDKARLGKESWKEQFVAACYVNGSREEQNDAGIVDWIFHVVSLPWKFIFALVPPPEFGGGWVCFVTSLIFIGAVTACIGDFASLFGCALGWPPQITAITFVALGTSLPDTFASMSAAQADPYADASITNITGSNSVNVFLGLGLPWTVASLYWMCVGQTSEWKEKLPPSQGGTGKWPSHIKTNYPDSAVYVLEAGELGFSVAVFSCCALCAMGALAMRRVLFQGELGGPKLPKIASSVYLVFLWLLYIGASWLYIKASE